MAQEIMASGFAVSGSRRRSPANVHPSADIISPGDLASFRDQLKREMLGELRQETNGRIENLELHLRNTLAANRALTTEIEMLRLRSLTEAQYIKELERIAEEHENEIEGLREQVQDYMNENQDLRERLSRLRQGRPETKNWWKIACLIFLGAIVGAGVGGVVAAGGTALYVGGAAGAVVGGIYGYKTS